MQSLFAILLAAPGMASASDIDIKDTNYPIPSDAYFVSPDGLDTNSGTQASPWSIAKALTSAPSGATIVFRGGTYRNTNNAGIRKKLTLQPYPHEKAWLKGSVTVTGWVANGTIWRKDGWTYSFPSNVGSEYIDPQYPMAGYRDMVYINGVSLKQVGSVSEVAPGKFYVDSANKQLYIGDNPAGKTVEATALEKAFTMWTTDSSKPSDTIIRGLGFAHYADAALIVGAPRVTLENNTFIWNGLQGARFEGTSNGTLGISSDAIVGGNTFSYNGLSGLRGDRAHRMLFENNTISYNNVESFARGWDAAGIKATRTDSLRSRNNLFEHNFANAIWVDISSTNANIVHNTIRYNRGTGIFFEVSHYALIGANVVYNNNTGIMVSNSSSARVYNNTLSLNKLDLQIKDTQRNNTNPNEIAAGITWIARDNVVKNNILSNTTGDHLFDASNCDTKEQSALMVPTLDYNAYYRTSSSTPKNVIKWSLGAGWSKVQNLANCEVRYASVAAFNSETGFEAHGLAIDNVATNPFFANEANGDFRLKMGSPAIGRGAPLQPESAAAIGVPPGVKLDLGALQATVY
jgi:parallel beta-helix repeat protein